MIFCCGDLSIAYDDTGDGFPILVIAPGGMRSAAALWDNAPWDPRHLDDTYRVIAMDQRNAGRSTGPIETGDGWHTYTGDQVALLDHLGIKRCHVVGMCIGGPFIIGLLRRDPSRFASAILLQPVGIEDDGSNRSAFYDVFNQWADAQLANRPDLHPDITTAMRSAMWDGEFVLTATPEEIAEITTPLLVARGNDLYHPTATSELIAEQAPDATLVPEWKTGSALAVFDQIARGFLADHTP